MGNVVIQCLSRVAQLYGSAKSLAKSLAYTFNVAVKRQMYLVWPGMREKLSDWLHKRGQSC